MGCCVEEGIGGRLRIFLESMGSPMMISAILFLFRTLFRVTSKVPGSMESLYKAKFIANCIFCIVSREREGQVGKR